MHLPGSSRKGNGNPGEAAPLNPFSHFSPGRCHRAEPLAAIPSPAAEEAMPGMPGGPGMPRVRAQAPDAVIQPPPPRRSHPRRAGRPFNRPRPLLRDLTNREARCAPSGQWQGCPSLERANRQQRRRTNSKKARPRGAGAAPGCHVGLAGPRVRVPVPGGVAMASNAASLNAVRETMDGA